MQFYLNGYKTGDPFIEDPHPSVAERPGGLPDDADVVSSAAVRPVSCWLRKWRTFPTSERWSSTARTVRSRLARPTESLAEPSAWLDPAKLDS
jgi:hypothetical protein